MVIREMGITNVRGGCGLRGRFGRRESVWWRSTVRVDRRDNSHSRAMQSDGSSVLRSRIFGLFRLSMSRLVGRGSEWSDRPRRPSIRRSTRSPMGFARQRAGSLRKVRRGCVLGSDRASARGRSLCLLRSKRSDVWEERHRKSAQMGL